MIIFVWLILGAVSILFVLFPFLRSAKVETRRSTAASPGRGAPGIVHELESDYRTGILSKEEYDELKAEYAPDGKAESALTASERLRKDDDIERRVRELRQRKAGGSQPAKPDASIQPKPSGPQGPKGLKKQPVCPKCGEPYKQGDKFCTGCGARLSRGGG